MLILLTVVTMMAFASNSLVTRLAFQTTHIDSASFTAARLGAGAIVLLAMKKMRLMPASGAREAWTSAAILFGYAIAVSYAYRGIGPGAGARRPTNTSRQTCAVSGPHETAGRRWPWSSTAIRERCWAGTCLARASHYGLQRSGAGPDCPVRDIWCCARAIPAEVGQWLNVHQSPLHGLGEELRVAPGVHHPALPAANRHRRVRDSNAQVAMRASTPLREPAAFQPGHW
jgi:hypothetical protein